MPRLEDIPEDEWKAIIQSDEHKALVRERFAKLRRGLEAIGFYDEFPDQDTQFCKWIYDEVHFKWDSECGEAWQFMNDGPEENGCRFCFSCGRQVLVEEPSIEEFDE